MYLEDMRWLREAIRQKRTELWKNQSRILHHDNAPAHTSMLVREFLAKNAHTVSFICNLGVHHEFLSQGCTVNKEYYLEDMRWLREAIRQKRTELWKNAAAHISMLVREFLAKNNTAIMPQPRYLLDLAPANFFLFPKLKTAMKGKRFATIVEIKAKSKQELLVIPKSAFQKCMQGLEKTLA